MPIVKIFISILIFFSHSSFADMHYITKFNKKESKQITPKRHKNRGRVEIFLKDTTTKQPQKSQEVNIGWFNLLSLNRELRSRLKDAGLSNETINALSKHFNYHEQTKKKHSNQPEFNLTLEDYLKKIKLKEKIAYGKKYIAQNQSIFKNATEIDILITTALIGMETDYGRQTGSVNVVQALYSVYVQTQQSPVRQKFFFDNILACGKLFEAKVFDLNTKGSWSGAVGNMQFMPTNLAEYGMLFDGKMEVFNPTVAHINAMNYLTDVGWKKNAPFLTRVRLPKDFDVKQIGIFEEPKNITDFKKMGIVANGIGKEHFKDNELPGDLIVPDFIHADLTRPEELNAFIIYQNAHAIYDWNRSLIFVIAVGEIYENLKS